VEAEEEERDKDQEELHDQGEDAVCHREDVQHLVNILARPVAQLPLPQLKAFLYKEEENGRVRK